MALIVEKFGGTSVGDVDRIHAVADQIAHTKASGVRLVVVLSAMAGETNRLLDLGTRVSPASEHREIDVLISTGEQVTVALLALALEARGVPARSYTGDQVRIVTDNVHGKARIMDIETHRIEADLAEDRVVIVAGFQGQDLEGNITTLGRGGSDTTAVALAAALNSSAVQQR